MTVKPDSITWYYWDGDSWEDITGYVRIRPAVSCKWGMATNSHTDKLAKTGEMRMTLDNRSDQFDPANAGVLTGWGINAKVKMEVTYDGRTRVKFHGRVDSIRFSDPHVNERTAAVTVTDFMGYLYDTTIGEMSIETYKRGGVLVDALVDATGQTPLATDYDEGDYLFDAAYDTMTTTTKAAAEINKIVLGENGYFYCRHDGETLVFEAESARHAGRTVANVPILESLSGFLLKGGSATDKVLLAGSATDRIILNEAETADVDSGVKKFFRTHGEDMLNRVKVTAHPKRVDTAVQTIYSLGTPIMLIPGETKQVTVTYANASTKERCNAISELCSQPVATTDYLMNRNKEGTGTNDTAYLLVDVEFFTSNAVVTLTNTNLYTGYVTRLYLKGYGVYQDSKVDSVAENEESKTLYGIHELSIDQQYQRDVKMGEAMANRILNMEMNPRTKLEKITMIANISAFMMFSFLVIDIGDLVKVTEASLDLADNYYVQGIEASIRGGDVIEYSWILKEPDKVLTEELSYTDISIEFTNVALQKVMFLSEGTSDLPEKTIMLEVDLDGFGDTGATRNDLVASSGFYWDLYIGPLNERIGFAQIDNMGGLCYWVTADSTVDTGVHHYAVTYDNRLATNDPIVYIDGVSSAVSEVSGPPVVPAAAETADGVSIGSSPSWGGSKSVDGKIRYVKIYNRILSALEVAAEYATPGSVTSGLVFSAPAVMTEALSDYEDLVLTPGKKVFDSTGNVLGTAYLSPVARLIP